MAGNKAFVFNSFTSISDFENTGIRGAFKMGIALNVRKRVDSLSCNQALVDIDNPSSRVIDQIVYFQVPASDGNTYLFGTSKIWQLASNGTITLKYTDPDGGICGAEEWAQSNGKSYLFWQTATKLKSKEIPGNSTWATDVNADIVIGSTHYTYPKTNLTSTTWHTSKVANGALIIANKDKLAFVAYDGSYTLEALQLVPGTVAKTILDRNDYAIIGASSATDALNAHIYSWQVGALTYIDKKRIAAKEINGMVDGAEVMLIQADGDGELFFTDFVNTLPVISFPYGGKVNPGGVVDDQGIMYFGVWNCTDTTKNGIYSYGRTKKNAAFALNFEYPITCTEIGSLGVTAGLLHVAYKNNTDYRVYKVDTTTKQVATYYSLDRVAPIKLPHRSSVFPHIKLVTKKMPAGTSIAVKYRIDKDEAATADGWVSAQLMGDVVSSDVDNSVESVFRVGAKGNIIETQVILTPHQNATPEVYRIEIPVM